MRESKNSLNKNYFHYTIFIVVLLCIFIGILIFGKCFQNEIKDQILNYSLLIATIGGFLMTFHQLKISTEEYFVNFNKSKNDFLDLEMDIETEKDYLKIKTKVFNKSGDNKKIEFAFLIISEQDTDFLKTINYLTNSQFLLKFTNDLLKLKKYLSEYQINSKDLKIIPLKFYYEENIRIGNESPSYTHLFNFESLSKDKFYSVRFFIFPTSENNNIYHRTSCAGFKI